MTGGTQCAQCNWPVHTSMHILALCLIAHSVAGEPLRWQRYAIESTTVSRNASRPMARAHAAFAYHTTLQFFVVFGGQTAVSNYLNDTWVLDATASLYICPLPEVYGLCIEDDGTRCLRPIWHRVHVQPVPVHFTWICSTCSADAMQRCVLTIYGRSI
jgi:hypothetical protein